MCIGAPDSAIENARRADPKIKGGRSTSSPRTIWLVGWPAASIGMPAASRAHYSRVSARFSIGVGLVGVSLTVILSAFFFTVDSPMPLTRVKSAGESKRPWVSR